MDIIPQRRCSDCLLFFDLTPENFQRDKYVSGGFKRYCKSCSRVKQKVHYAKAKEHGPIEQPPEEILCHACNVMKPPQDFQKSPLGKYGLAFFCKPCAYEVGKRSMQKPEVRAKARARNREYAREHKEQHSEWHKNWYAENREYSLEKDRQFRIDHPEILAQRWQNWAKTERGYERCRIRVRSRRARKRGAQGNYTYADIQKQLTNQRSKCYYCHVKLGKDFHIDHIVPISRGGSNDISNIVIACPTCNLSKKDKLLHEWHQGGRLM